MKIEVSDKLYKLYYDIQLYCVLNELDFDEYITDLLKKSFMIDKYGERPFSKAVPYEKPLPSNEIALKPTEVEIEVKKNEETKEYVVETKETTIPVETVDKDKEELDLLKDTLKSALAAHQKPVDGPIGSVKDEPINEPINEPTSEPIKEKPKRRKLK